MGDAKHTPGPWVVHGRSGETQPIQVGKEICGPEYRLAVVYQPQNGKKDAEANARLIAAAPDLLAACKAAAAYIGKRMKDGEGIAAYEAVTAAIAKTEGR